MNRISWTDGEVVAAWDSRMKTIDEVVALCEERGLDSHAYPSRDRLVRLHGRNPRIVLAVREIERRGRGRLVGAAVILPISDEMVTEYHEGKHQSGLAIDEVTMLDSWAADGNGIYISILVAARGFEGRVVRAAGWVLPRIQGSRLAFTRPTTDGGRRAAKRLGFVPIGRHTPIHERSGLLFESSTRGYRLARYDKRLQTLSGVLGLFSGTNLLFFFVLSIISGPLAVHVWQLPVNVSRKK